jgi:arabinogalactan oligomer/maltooligosaccharide transport system substrate-binding protein
LNKKYIFIQYYNDFNLYQLINIFHYKRESFKKIEIILALLRKRLHNKCVVKIQKIFFGGKQMKTWKKSLIGAFALAAAGLTLAGCGSSGEKTTDSAQSGKPSGDVKLWVDTNMVPLYKDIVKDFNEKYPDVKVTIKADSSADAKSHVSKDPAAAADVFMFPHDQLGQLVEQKLVYENKKFADDVKDNNVDSAVEGATYKGKLYGYPYGVESQILYYNKSKLTADDVKTWDGITSKGKIGTNFAEAGANYIFGTLFMSNGDVLYGENGEDLKGTNFNNDKGVEVMKWIAAQGKNSGVVQANASALSNLQAGKTDAFLSGPWSKNDAMKALGDNFAVAPYPTIDFGSGAKQFKAFLGVKLFGVNAATKNPLAAMTLADFITQESAQLKSFKDQGTVPANKKAQESSEVKDDAVASAVMAMSDKEHSVVMPKLPQMTAFWPPMDALINDDFKGKIPEDQMKAKLDTFVANISKDSQSN